MAKLFLLTAEQIKSGNRPKTPRDKQRQWSKVCLVLTILIVAENLFLLLHGIK
jgi:hypothetical protein